MSSLAWIDFDEAERQRTQRIIDLFSERETRDELGLGAIRDSLADHFFPGTSTIQTRLRYVLFVPWIYRRLEGAQSAPRELAAQARALQNELSESLKRAGETTGVIGRDAGAALLRLPSSVYWASLGAWGIRVFPGSEDSVFASLGQLGRAGAKRTRTEDGDATPKGLRIWHADMPEPPADFLQSTSFGLTAEEAQFIVDRLVSQQPDSLLATLARLPDAAADYRYIWEHPKLADFPDAMRSRVRHAELFSSVMHGAALLYNLLLSRLRDSTEWIDAYEMRLRTWAEGLDLAALRAWSLDDFWRAVEHVAHRVHGAAKVFVSEWVEQVLAGQPIVADGGAASQLVIAREQRLKTNQSRFLNRTARDNWRGASGADRLGFRWAQARNHLQDLAHAG